MATEVAYYTYMYAKVPKEHYQQVTGHTRAGILIGRFLSGIVGQLLISFNVMNVKELTYISLGGEKIFLAYTGIFRAEKIAC